MASLDASHVEKKFKSVTVTQESIQSISLWCIHHKSQHEKIVDLWFNVLKRSKMPHRLTLFYLANDIVQTCRRKHAVMYKDAFKEVLKDATLLVRDNSVRAPIERIFQIWKERGIYDEEFSEELVAIINNTKVRATMNSKLLAEFQPLSLMEKIITLKRFEDEIELKRRHLRNLRLDASSIEAVKQLKDRTHGGEFCAEFEGACTKMEDYVKSLEKEIADRVSLIEMLEQSELYYDAQYSEAKIVANAYKNFGARVNALKRKLEEMSATLPDGLKMEMSSDAPSPTPSQSPDMSDHRKHKHHHKHHGHHHKHHHHQHAEDKSRDDEAYNPGSPIPLSPLPPGVTTPEYTSGGKTGKFDNTEAVDMEMSDEEDQHNSSSVRRTGNSGPPDKRDEEGYMSPVSDGADDDIAGPQGSPLVLNQEEKKSASYIPEVAKRAPASFLDEILKGPSRTSSSNLKDSGSQDDGGSTPVMDEFEGEGDSRKETSTKQNPIDFLTQLIGQSSKTDQSGSSFLEKVSMLTKSVHNQGVDDEDEKGADSWAAWKAQNAPPPAAEVPPPLPSSLEPQPPTPTDMPLPPPPKIHPTLLPPPTPPFAGPLPPPPFPPQPDQRSSGYPPQPTPPQLPPPTRPVIPGYPLPPTGQPSQQAPFPPSLGGPGDVVLGTPQNYYGGQNTYYPPSGNAYVAPQAPAVQGDGNYAPGAGQNFTAMSQGSRFPPPPPSPGVAQSASSTKSSPSTPNYLTPHPQMPNYPGQTTPPSPYPPSGPPPPPPMSQHNFPGGPRFPNAPFPPTTYATPNAPTQSSPANFMERPRLADSSIYHGGPREGMRLPAPNQNPLLGRQQHSHMSEKKFDLNRPTSQDSGGGSNWNSSNSGSPTWNSSDDTDPSHSSVQFNRSNLTTIKTVDDEEFGNGQREYKPRPLMDVHSSAPNDDSNKTPVLSDFIKRLQKKYPPTMPTTPLYPIQDNKHQNNSDDNDMQDSRKGTSANLRTLTQIDASMDSSKGEDAKMSVENNNFHGFGAGNDDRNETSGQSMSPSKNAPSSSNNQPANNEQYEEDESVVSHTVGGMLNQLRAEGESARNAGGEDEGMLEGSGDGFVLGSNNRDYRMSGPRFSNNDNFGSPYRFRPPHHDGGFHQRPFSQQGSNQSNTGMQRGNWARHRPPPRFQNFGGRGGNKGPGQMGFRPPHFGNRLPYSNARY